MGTYEKQTRSHLREVAALWDQVRDKVRVDLEAAQSEFEVQLKQRAQHLGEVFLELARERDAALGQLADVRRDLARLRKRLRKVKEPRDVLRVSVIELADGIRLVRSDFAALRDRLEAARLAAPTSHHLVANLLQGVERAGATWEQASRQVEDHYAELVDSGLPGELSQIEEEMVDGGMGHWLAEDGEDRSGGELAELLRSMMHLRAETASVDELANPVLEPSGGEDETADA